MRAGVAMELKDFAAGQWSDEALIAAVSQLGIELVPGSLGAVRANLELLAERSRVLVEALAEALDADGGA